MCKHNREPKTARELLQKIGAIHVRTGKHEVWKLPNGRTVTLSISPSCPFVNCKQMADIHREMRIQRYESERAYK